MVGAWPARREWPAIAGLGRALLHAVVPILFNASLIFTTAPRRAGASDLALLTMVLVGAALGSEALTSAQECRRADCEWAGGRGGWPALGLATAPKAPGAAIC